MTATGLCFSCRPDDWFLHYVPSHCYGAGDKPAPEGVLGGFRCSCECRTWSKDDEAKP